MTDRLYKTAWVRNINVKYFIIEEFVQNERPVYGLRIEYGKESVMIKNISTSYREIKGLAELLARGRVTPVTVPDIIEDWLAR